MIPFVVSPETHKSSHSSCVVGIPPHPQGLSYADRAVCRSSPLSRWKSGSLCFCIRDTPGGRHFCVGIGAALQRPYQQFMGPQPTAGVGPKLLESHLQTPKIGLTCQTGRTGQTDHLFRRLSLPSSSYFCPNYRTKYRRQGLAPAEASFCGVPKNSCNPQR